MSQAVCSTTLIEPSHIHFVSNDTANTAIYTLSLHDALPISRRSPPAALAPPPPPPGAGRPSPRRPRAGRRTRSEEHTSELQSRVDLVCRLLLEKKKKDNLPQTRQSSSIQYADSNTKH